MCEKNNLELVSPCYETDEQHKRIENTEKCEHKQNENKKFENILKITDENRSHTMKRAEWKDFSQERNGSLKYKLILKCCV